MNFCSNSDGKVGRKLKVSLHKQESFYAQILPIMPALCSILNSTYHANNYAGIFDAGLYWIILYCTWAFFLEHILVFYSSSVCGFLFVY